LWCGGFDNTHPQGEVGILKTVFVSSVKPSTSCFLIMEHAGAEYMGELFVSDAAFCMEIYEMLLRHCGKTIQEVGDLDLSDTRQVAIHLSTRNRPSHPALSPATAPRLSPLLRPLINPFLAQLYCVLLGFLVSDSLMHGRFHAPSLGIFLQSLYVQY
jgi:hypothetical protein